MVSQFPDGIMASYLGFACLFCVRNEAQSLCALGFPSPGLNFLDSVLKGMFASRLHGVCTGKKLTSRAVFSEVQVWYSSDIKNDMCAGFTEKNQQQLRDDYDTDENEAESERDKQAVLAGNDGDKNGRKCVGVVTSVLFFLFLNC